jgi:hypothetical protein
MGLSGLLDTHVHTRVKVRQAQRLLHSVAPARADLDRLLRVLVCQETVCFIEDLPMYRGKMNLRSTAVLFRNFGRIEGVLASVKCRVEYLKPDWWQKALRLGKSAARITERDGGWLA